MADNILTIIFIISILLYFIPCVFILPYTLGKKFDCIMDKYNLSLPDGFGIMPPHITRANVYAINIVVFPDPKKYPKLLKYYKLWFGNFWFRAHASTWDKIQAWYIVLTSGIAFLSLFLIALNMAVQYVINIL